MAAPPDVHIPASSATVSVKILKAFEEIAVPANNFFATAPGADPRALQANPSLVCPGYSFLIEHAPTGRKAVFDLGLRKDLRGLAPLWTKLLDLGVFSATIDKDVAEQLTEAGVDLASISEVIWSHAHLDHVGDMTTFPGTTALVVGPGTQAHARPAYPLNPDAKLRESDFSGREVREIEFASGPNALTISGLPALDYFGDGSFYLLDTPGHCPGHICGFARVAPSPAAAFIFMGGDLCHHPAQLRPSPLQPLPARLARALPAALRDAGAPGYTAPFIVLPAPDVQSSYHDVAVARASLDRVLALDARADVLVVLAHDASLDGVLPLFPRVANGWKEEGVKERTLWAWLEEGNKGWRWDVAPIPEAPPSL